MARDTKEKLFEIDSKKIELVTRHYSLSWLDGCAFTCVFKVHVQR